LTEITSVKIHTRLRLNSFWGKFGQRTNLPKTEIVKLYQHLTTLLTNSEHKITDILPVNDDVIYVFWALARLKLCSYLELLDRRVLYYDIDSCIYVSTGEPNEYKLHTGNFLGDIDERKLDIHAIESLEEFLRVTKNL